LVGDLFFGDSVNWGFGDLLGASLVFFRPAGTGVFEEEKYSATYIIRNIMPNANKSANPQLTKSPI
jgi:hypothetical protein